MPTYKERMQYLLNTRMRLRDEASKLSEQARRNDEGLAVVSDLISQQKPCPRCEGLGGYSVMTDQDDSHYETCETCKGMGQKP